MSNRRRRLLAEINVVPYIDVMLVLLVIFMVTAPLLTQGVQVSLPETQAKKLPHRQKPPLIVSVDVHGQYFLNVADQPSQPLSRQQLLAKVTAYQRLSKQNEHKRPIYVKGDQSVNYGKVVQAMVLLQRAGVGQVGLLTKKPQNAS